MGVVAALRAVCLYRDQRGGHFGAVPVVDIMGTEMSEVSSRPYRGESP
jgi:hypothetical protein